MRRRSVRFLLVSAALAAASAAGALVIAMQAPAPAIPSMFSRISAGESGALEFRTASGDVFTERMRPPAWTVEQLQGSPRGTDTGIAFDFAKPGFTGTLVFGLVSYHDTKYPQPVYRTSAAIKDGKVEVNIKGTLSGVYDMAGWQKAGSGVLGYRIITSEGLMVYDGRLRFSGTGPFTPDTTLIEGPFVGNVTARSAVVWFTLSRPDTCELKVAGRTVPCAAGSAHQELLVDGLASATDYSYTLTYDGFEERYGFRTAPVDGSQRPFTFAYASDSRGGQGGGDRNFSGPNAYIMRRIMASARQRDAAFMLFTGDLVGGGVTSPLALHVELANWKRTVEPQGHWLPVYTGIGNHEAVVREFVHSGGRIVRVDRFPYATESMEATFASALVNPTNGPESEDGSALDPDPGAIDFPSYRENAYSFTHGNAAMVVLNSNYWYSPTMGSVADLEGNPHAYLMDNQIAWLERTLAAYEKTPKIDHVFLTVHTPVFPNGGHVGDDMWYGGKNDMRPRVGGKPVGKGIIERRDDLLTLIQRYTKVVAVLTGDEHNYNRLRLSAEVPIYPDGWAGKKVVLRRPFHQVNNGAAGAPYYAQDKTPWSAFVRGFSTQHALCFFHVSGLRVRLEVVNPETLEVIDTAVLR